MHANIRPELTDHPLPPSSGPLAGRTGLARPKDPARRLARPPDRAVLVLHEGPLSRSDRRPPGPGPADVPTPDACLLRLEGEYWTIAYAGQVLRLRDAVGLRHLAQLLRYPQREFHALDLMRALALSGGSRGGRPPRTDAPEVDAHAATAYRHRLSDLPDELAEAEAQDDLGRVGAIRSHLDAILRELRHGVRGRHLRVDAERARIAVTKALKTTLGRIRGPHPALASHLDACVKRGYVCVYRPDPRSPIRWDW